jgi:1,4-alpha-glucan branching enzyme
MKTEAIAPARTPARDTTRPTQNPRNAQARSGARSEIKPFGGPKEVFFEVDARDAKEVWLAGDFTDWEKSPIRLQKGERGSWRTTVKLVPGQYHYKFVIDGQWKDDPRATVSRPNPFGTCDSVLEIS